MQIYIFIHYNCYLNHIGVVKASKNPERSCVTLLQYPGVGQWEEKVPVKCREQCFN